MKERDNISFTLAYIWSNSASVNKSRISNFKVLLFMISIDKISRV